MLLSRNESTVVLTDAKALKKQIEKNISTSEQTKERLTKALELMGTTGLGFLDVSNTPTNAPSADAVTRVVRDAILARGARRSDAAGLVDPIVSASLLRMA
jgi:hypothetical protein